MVRGQILKKRTVKINGSVRFALLTVRLKNGRDRGKKRYNEKNGKRYGPDSLRYETDTVTNALL